MAGCGVCGFEEKAARKDCEYLCSNCVIKFGNATREQIIQYSQSLRKKEKEKEADFLEMMLVGFITKIIPSTPKLLLRKKEIDITPTLILRKV